MPAMMLLTYPGCLFAESLLPSIGSHKVSYFCRFTFFISV